MKLKEKREQFVEYNGTAPLQGESESERQKPKKSELNFNTAKRSEIKLGENSKSARTNNTNKREREKRRKLAAQKLKGTKTIKQLAKDEDQQHER